MSEAARKANRYALAWRDMEDVKRYLTAFMELDLLQKQEGTSRYFDHCEAAMIAAVVAYCRPFKKSNAGGNADSRINDNDLLVLDSDSEIAKLHLQLMALRDKAIAHADWSQHSTELISVSKSSLMRRITYPKFTEGIKVETFRQLVASVQNELIERGHSFDKDAKKSQCP